MSPYAWFALFAIIAAGVLSGCQSGERARGLALDDEPLTSADGHRRSLALDAPYQRTLAARGDPSDSYPWWEARSDAKAATYAGYVGPVYLYSFTRTVDRQSDFSGRPRPHSTDTAYRGRILQGVR